MPHRGSGACRVTTAPPGLTKGQRWLGSATVIEPLFGLDQVLPDGRCISGILAPGPAASCVASVLLMTGQPEQLRCYRSLPAWLIGEVALQS